jgi:hypothetical protein
MAVAWQGNEWESRVEAEQANMMAKCLLRSSHVIIGCNCN